jgi:signal transduction histidine kinase
MQIAVTHDDVRVSCRPAHADVVLTCVLAGVVGLATVGGSLSAAVLSVALVLPLIWWRARPGVAVLAVFVVGLGLLVWQLARITANGSAPPLSPFSGVDRAAWVAYVVVVLLVHQAGFRGSRAVSVSSGLLGVSAVVVEGLVLSSGYSAIAATVVVATGFAVLPVLASWGVGALRKALAGQPVAPVAATLPEESRLRGPLERRLLSERLDQWLSTHVGHTDAALAATLALVLGLLELSVNSGVDHVLTTVALLLPLAWRRTRPVRCLVVVAGLALAQWTTDLVAGLTHGFVTSAVAPGTTDPVPVLSIASPRFGDVSVFLVVYAVAAYGSRRAGTVAVVLGSLGGLMEVALLFVSDVTVAGGSGVLSLLSVAGLVVVAVVGVWALGTLRRSRVNAMQGLRERARLLEVERDQQARLATAAERARIAREMHDVVAHSLAVVIAQADGGRYAAQSASGAASGVASGASSDAAVQALETIGQTGRQALAEMRALLGVLRDDGTDPVWAGRTAGAAVTAPQPDVDAVPDLVAQVSATGLPVTLRVDGSPQPLSRATGLAVYRLVQEGLTNVIKHGGPAASAEVTLSWTATALQVTVSDDGRGAGASAPDPGGGQGLVGMRERVVLSGGEFEAGPRPGGGFVVRARLPIDVAMDEQARQGKGDV